MLVSLGLITCPFLDLFACEEAVQELKPHTDVWAPEYHQVSRQTFVQGCTSVASEVDVEVEVLKELKDAIPVFNSPVIEYLGACLGDFVSFVAKLTLHVCFFILVLFHVLVDISVFFHIGAKDPKLILSQLVLFSSGLHRSS
jgi:hypothetical protein